MFVCTSCKKSIHIQFNVVEKKTPGSDWFLKNNAGQSQNSPNNISGPRA